MLSVVLQLSFIISQATKLWLIKFLLLQLLFLFCSVAKSNLYEKCKWVLFDGTQRNCKGGNLPQGRIEIIEYTDWVGGEQRGGPLRKIVVLSTL